ncbi:MAG: COX15/CtaA family protein [Gammaproteobacteria bacterium]|nr:COX15/CtaA family protein [Gammaproteobacteria bacterium]
MSPRLTWFRRLARLAAVFCAIVVVVGAWVRLTDAGLGCPDWPGCYGHLHPAQVVDQAAEINAANPDRPFEYQKALNEMVHRYIASTLGLLIIGLAVLSLLNRRDREQPRVLPWVLLGVVITQGLLGMFTVTLLLKPLVVTAHLAGGLTTLSMLWWLSLSPQKRELKAAERPVRRLAIIALVMVAMQILLGGWTSTNYAAAACSDFPQCQASWWPGMDFRNAFVLWRGLGIDYEGGVLSAPARVAIHYSHRIGALMVTVVLVGLVIFAWWRGQTAAVRYAATAVLAALTLQLLIGMNLVWQGWPLWLGTAHNAGAALTLLALVTLLRLLTPRSPSGSIAMRA